MAAEFKGRSFLTLLDYSPEEIRCLLDLAKDFKKKKKAGELHKYLEGRNIVLLFEKTSTRTRCAFEVAGMDLGMGVTFLSPNDSQMGKKESISDTAHVLGRMYDGIEFRGFRQETVEILARDSGVPVWNGLTDKFHPTQVLADLLTIEEKKGRLKGLNFTPRSPCFRRRLLLKNALQSLRKTAAALSSRKTSPRARMARISSTRISGCPWASPRAFGNSA